MDKALKNVIIASLLIVSISIGYYFVIYLPKKGNALLELSRVENEIKLKNQQELEACLAIADAEYELNWNNFCKSLNRKDYCSLSDWEAQRLDDFKQNTKENCFKRYN